MSEEIVPLLNLDGQHFDENVISVTLENENTLKHNVIVPNVTVHTLDENNGNLTDENIIQEENIDVDNVQAVLLSLKGRRHNILEKGPPLPKGKEAHIFVSYSSNDKALVFPIIAELEQKHSLACIFDDRDFQSGYQVLDNINKSIDMSAKVLIFLSNEYNKSRFCKHENDVALIASLENGESMIIPVLLEECDVPRSIRTLTYIDASKQQTRQTIGLEIYQAFILPDCPDKFLASFGKTDQGVVNGFHVDISCCRDSKTCHRFGRPSREYMVLNEDVCKEIKNEKIEVSDDLLLKVVQLINNHFEDGTCASMHKCGCPVSVGVCMCIICGVIIVSVLWLLADVISGQLPTDDAIIKTKRWVADSKVIIFGMVPIISIVVATISTGCQGKLRRTSFSRLRVELFEHITSKYYKSNVLFSIGENRTSCQGTLFLRILHYNVLACEKHVMALLKADIKFKDIKDVEVTAKELVVSHLKTWLTSGLVDVNSLPDVVETRHRVKGGKKCLCQLLEAQLVKQPGFAHI